MGAKVSAVRPDFVGEISGIDLCEELSQEEFAVVRSAVAEYGVVIVRDQHINDEQQARFTRLFGALELPGAASNITQNSDRRLGAEIADLSNLDKDGNLLVGDARQRMFNLGNRLCIQIARSSRSQRNIPCFLHVRCQLLVATPSLLT